MGPYTVTMTNDLGTSEFSAIRIPANPAVPQSLSDTDGDSLCNEWEQYGLDVNGDGTTDEPRPERISFTRTCTSKSTRWTFPTIGSCLRWHAQQGAHGLRARQRGESRWHDGSTPAHRPAGDTLERVPLSAFIDTPGQPSGRPDSVDLFDLRDCLRQTGTTWYWLLRRTYDPRGTRLPQRAPRPLRDIPLCPLREQAVP